MTIETFIQTSLYFLALINPASKVLILSQMQPQCSRHDILKISSTATLVALAILLILSAIGHFILKEIFHVEIYSLQIAGGVVLFVIGLSSIRRGHFFEQDRGERIEDFSIVPLAAPMIAGPGTITAAISFSSTLGLFATIVSLTTAILINYLIMLSSSSIGKTFERFHAFGPLIRITGLIVAAVAVQMILTGVSQWLKPLIE